MEGRMNGFRPQDTEDLERWCSMVPELQPDEPGRWRAAAVGEVSFPVSGHGALAEIEPRSYWFAHRNAVISAVVRNHPPTGRIFDIGGGNGFVSVGLQAAGFPAAVIEPGPQGARIAAERGLPAIQAAFQDLTIPDGSIPSAGLFDVLEHIEDDRAALAGLYRTIQPGGMLYIAVPAHQALWSTEDVEAGHFRRYSLTQLTGRMAEAGFDVRFASYFFAALAAPILLLRALPDRLGLYGKHSVERTSEAHTLPDNIVGRMIGAAFARELERIRSDRAVRWGASCIVACRKPGA